MNNMYNFSWFLQAIAVAACVQDSWPVLILAPSALRLQWASVRVIFLYFSSFIVTHLVNYVLIVLL